MFSCFSREIYDEKHEKLYTTGYIRIQKILEVAPKWPLKTAKQMAAEATREDEAAMASSFKKTKKVMIESSSKIV